MKKKICSLFLAAVMIVATLGGFSYFFNKSVVNAEAKTDTVIVIDPGHGGSDSGATGSGYQEKNLTLKISKAIKSKLEEYSHVKVYLTRTTDKYVGLSDRTAYAASVGADVFVSIHLNAAATTAPNGCEIYYPNNHYDTNAYTVGKSLATNIQKNLKALGLFDRQIKTRSSANGTRYPDGSTADYYAVIRTAKLHHIPGIIVEGAFISSPHDVSTYLNSDAKIQKMAAADANGIATTLNLVLKSDDDSLTLPDTVSLYSAKADAKTNAVTIRWKAAPYASEYIVYRKSSLKDEYKRIGVTTTTSYTDKTGSYGTKYYYTVVAQNSAGRSKSYSKNGVSTTTPRRDTVMVSAVDNGLSRVKVTWKKDSSADGYRVYRKVIGGRYSRIAALEKNVTTYTDETVSKNKKYNYTVRAYYKVGNVIVLGTYQDGKAKVTTDGDPASTLSGVMTDDASSIILSWTASKDSDVKYRLYRKEADGSYSKVNDGTKKLTYTDTDIEPGVEYYYKLRYYRNSVNSSKKTFWSDYSNVLSFTVPEESNSDDSGTTENTSDENVSSGTDTSVNADNVSAAAETTLAAQAAVNSSAISAADQVKKAEIKWRSAYTAVKSSSDTLNYDSDTKDYVTPASDTSLTLHWYPVEGVTGYQIIDPNGKRVTSVRGDDINEVTINGLKARTTYTYRVRAFIKSGKNYFGPASVAASGTTGYLIKGTSSTSPQQMARFFNAQTTKKKTTYPSDIYANYGAATIDDFTRIVYDEAEKAGVRAEVLFAQICNETGFLGFGGNVSAEQCNFGGIAALDGSNSGMDFVKYARLYYSALGYSSSNAAVSDAVRVGIRAQAIHLSLYASADGKTPSYSTVPTVSSWPAGGTVAVPDPRASQGIVGIAPYVEWLGIKDNHYTTGEAGDRIAKIRGWASLNNYGYILIDSYITPLLNS